MSLFHSCSVFFFMSLANTNITCSSGAEAQRPQSARTVVSFFMLLHPHDVIGKTLLPQPQNTAELNFQIYTERI